MSSSSYIDSTAIYHAETFIKSVVRAFYNDTAIIIIGTLLRERYITREEIAPRLKLSNKLVNGILKTLEDDHLIEQEKVYDPKTKSEFLCCYIDYQQCIDSLLYRLHQMEAIIREEESHCQREEYYECPTCHYHYTTLEAMQNMTMTYKKICFRCCPHANLSLITDPEPYYTLQLINKQEEIQQLKALKHKFEVQCTGEEQRRIGMFDYKRRCKDLQLIQNLPSVNISRGIKSSTIMDLDTKEKIAQNLKLTSTLKGSSSYGGSRINQRAFKKHQDGHFDGHDTTGDMEIEIIQSDTELEEKSSHPMDVAAKAMTTSKSTSSSTAYASIMEQSKPDFLKGSGVLGADEVLISVDTMQAGRNGQDTSRVEDGDSQKLTSKRKRNDMEESEDHTTIHVPTIEINFEDSHNLHEQEGDEGGVENIVWEEEGPATSIEISSNQQSDEVTEEPDAENIEWDE